MAFCTSASRVTSQGTAKASPCPATSLRAAAAAFSQASALTSAIATRPPSAQNIAAATRPMPLAPPVTKQTLPSSRIENPLVEAVRRQGGKAVVLERHPSVARDRPGKRRNLDLLVPT